jgi:hypothetical protein
VTSQAMVLAASEPVDGDAEKEKVELVIPPAGAKVYLFSGWELTVSPGPRFMFPRLRAYSRSLFFHRRRKSLRLYSQGSQHCRI